MKSCDRNTKAQELLDQTKIYYARNPVFEREVLKATSAFSEAEVTKVDDTRAVTLQAIFCSVATPDTY